MRSMGSMPSRSQELIEPEPLPPPRIADCVKRTLEVISQGRLHAVECLVSLAGTQAVYALIRTLRPAIYGKVSFQFSCSAECGVGVSYILSFRPFLSLSKTKTMIQSLHPVKHFLDGKASRWNRDADKLVAVVSPYMSLEGEGVHPRSFRVVPNLPAVPLSISHSPPPSLPPSRPPTHRYFPQVKLGMTLHTRSEDGSYHMSTEYPVAIKIVRKDKLGGRSQEDPLKEISVMQYLASGPLPASPSSSSGGGGHPNVMGLVEVLQDTENIYIVLPFCDGGEVCQWFERSRYMLREEVRPPTLPPSLSPSLLLYVHMYVSTSLCMLFCWRCLRRYRMWCGCGCGWWWGVVL